MNKVFTAKLLNNLRNKKGEKGFTLIELLVVVIIIGVLAAVALPNLLGQVAKGRQSEAKNNLGAINRSQQAHRLETGLFGVIQPANVAAPVALLPVGITGDNYTYTDLVAAPDAIQASQGATAVAAFENDILDYTAAVNQQNDGTFVGIICQSDAVDGSTGPIGATAGTATTDPSCGTGSTAL
ncbi:pilin polypeptide [Chondrocystis sp. NIES-4102]|nr:pilin polypeptide [Chondrocystis sp. NIES-4102]